MGLSSNHLPTRSLSHAKYLTILSLAITVGFSVVVGTVLWESRGRDREQARQAASNVIALLSSEIDRNLELYDLSLQAVVDGMKLPAVRELSPEMRQLLLFDRAATAKDMGSIFILDPNGTVILDTDLSKVSEYMANSKHPGKDLKSGHFGFAGHNDPVQFRNVRIKKI